MTEERFTLDYIQSTWWRITDNSTGKSIENKERMVVDWLNSLNEENEQLKKELDSFKPVIFQDMRKGTVILYSRGGNDE